MSIFNLLSSVVSSENAGSNSGSWIMWVLLGVLVVVMIVPSFLRNKKERKAYEEKMSKMDIGCKVKTIGLIVGEIIAMTEDTVTIKTGTEDNFSFVTVEKRAVYEIIPSDIPVDVDSSDVFSDVVSTGSVSDDDVVSEKVENATSESVENAAASDVSEE